MSRFSATIVNSGLQSSVSNEHGIQTVDTEGSPVPGTPSSAAVASRKLRAVSTVCVPANSPAPEVDIPAILTPPSCTVTALAFSRDSEWVASGSSDGMITLRKVDNPDNKTQLAADTSQIYALAFSPKGERLASAHKSGEIKVWSIDHHRLGRVAVCPIADSYRCHTTKAMCTVDWSPDGRQIAACSVNGSLFIWSLSTERFERQPERPPFPYGALTFVLFSLDSCLLLFGGDYNHAYIWNLDDAEVPQVVLHTADTQRKLLHASFDPNSKHIITCSSNHTVRMWDSNTGDLRTVDEAFKGCIVLVVSFSLDCMRLIAHWWSERAIQFTRWKAYPRMRSWIPLRIHRSGPIKSARISPNGDYIASTSSDGTVYLTKTSMDA